MADTLAFLWGRSTFLTGVAARQAASANDRAERGDRARARVEQACVEERRSGAGAQAEAGETAATGDRVIRRLGADG